MIRETTEPHDPRNRLENGPVALHASRLRHRPQPETTRNGPRARRTGDGRASRALKLAGLGAGLAGLGAGLWALQRTGRNVPPVFRSLPEEGRLFRWRGQRVIYSTRSPASAAAGGGPPGAPPRPPPRGGGGAPPTPRTPPGGRRWCWCTASTPPPRPAR